MNNSKNDGHKKVFYPVTRNVQFREKGILFESPHHMNGKGLPDHLKEIKRGKVKGFTKASKKRMREAILSKGVPDGQIPYAVTLTIPGDDPLTPEQCKQLWEKVHKEFRRLGYCGFWRIEVQERVMGHWHLLLCAPADSEWTINPLWLRLLDELPKAMVSVTCYQAEYIDAALDGMWNGDEWLDAINFVETCLASEGYTTDYRKRKIRPTIVLPLCRSLIVGARERACDIQSGDTQSAWLRYINDHCTKAKQAQVVGFGGVRHWGYINKKLLPESSSSERELAFPESVQLLRVLSKWARPRIKADCIFGYKLGFRTARGRSGASVWFGNPDFYERALLWAKEHPAKTKQAEVAGEEKPASSRGFWNVYPLASRLQHVVSDSRAITRKLLLPGVASGGSRIESMLPVCSDGFKLKVRPEWISALVTS